jgi:cytochrome c oxidase subunit 4
MQSSLAENSDPSFDPHLHEEHAKYFTFFNVALAMILITAVEIVIIYIPIHKVIIFSSLGVLSLVKFLAVIWWFMHLRWDRALCTILFMMGLFIASGTVTALMFLFDVDPAGSPL